MKQHVPLPILFVIVLALGQAHAQSSSKSAAVEIPTVDYSELLRTPSAYDQKIIRVRGLYLRSGADVSRFYAPKSEENGLTWVEFVPSYELRTKTGYVRTLARMQRESGPRRGRPHSSQVIITFRRAEVIFVGKFEATLPAKVGKQIDFIKLSTTNPNDPNAASLSTVASDYAHYHDYQHVFTVQQVERVKPISPKAAW